LSFGDRNMTCKMKHMTIRTVLITGWLLLSGGLFGQTLNPVNKRGQSAEKEFATGTVKDQETVAQIRMNRDKNRSSIENKRKTKLTY
jgi:hypothetical protein